MYRQCLKKNSGLLVSGINTVKKKIKVKKWERDRNKLKIISMASDSSELCQSFNQ